MGSHLEERDARLLAGHIVEELHKLQVRPSQIRVHLESEGFWFMANIDGRLVWERTGQGNVKYRDVALALKEAARKAAADQHVHTA